MNLPGWGLLVLIVLGIGHPLLLCQEAPPAPAQNQPAGNELRIQGTFHITGIPGVRRDFLSALSARAFEVNYDQPHRQTGTSFRRGVLSDHATRTTPTVALALAAEPLYSL